MGSKVWDRSLKRVLKKPGWCRSPERAEHVPEEEDCSVGIVFGYATFPSIVMLAHRDVTDDSTTSKSDARSKSLGMRWVASAVTVRLSPALSGKTEWPTHANACANRLQQTKRVALRAIVP